MRRCSLSPPKTFALGPRKSSAPPTCPKSALSPLPLIRQLPPLTTTRIREEKCYASGASRHQPSPGPHSGVLSGVRAPQDAGRLVTTCRLGPEHTNALGGVRADPEHRRCLADQRRPHCAAALCGASRQGADDSAAPLGPGTSTTPPDPKRSR